MPVMEANRVPRNKSRDVRDMETQLVRFGTSVERSFGIDASEWTIAQIGREYWIANGTGRPIILLGKTASAALGHIKGLVHASHVEQTLIASRVLLPNWEDLL